MDHADVFAIFAKVGELESISGAARALGLPKANVSRAVSRLESNYGVQLLDRTKRRLRLTEVGHMLHRHCVRILDELHEADAEIAAHRGLPAGLLRVGCSADVARSLIGDGVPEFLERYPDIDLRLRIGDRLLPEPNSIDVVLHAGWLANSRLIVRKLADVPTVLVASRHYADRHGVPQDVDDLSNHRVLGNFYLDPVASDAGRLPARVPVLELVRRREKVTVPIWSRFASNNQSMMLSLVHAGIAIAPIAAGLIMAELRSGELIRVMPDWEIHDPPAIYALFTERSAIAPKLKVFLDFACRLIERAKARAA